MEKLTNEKKQFILDLEMFAKNWVDEVNNVILKHIDELYEDASVRYLVKKNADEVRDLSKRNEEYLLVAYYLEKDEVYRSRKLDDYTSVLYDLCYKRFKDEK